MNEPEDEVSLSKLEEQVFASGHEHFRDTCICCDDLYFHGYAAGQRSQIKDCEERAHNRRKQKWWML